MILRKQIRLSVCLCLFLLPSGTIGEGLSFVWAAEASDAEPAPPESTPQEEAHAANSEQAQTNVIPSNEGEIADKAAAIEDHAQNNQPQTKPVPGKNPTRQEISECMQNDLVRAVAWQESRWKQFKAGKAVRGLGGTGMMQVNPKAWTEWFQTDGKEPAGYQVCSWEEMKTNWRTNVHNGRYILEVYIPTQFTDEQQKWPKSSKNINIPNQQDLAVYAYKHSPEDVKTITPRNWVRRVARNTYVRQVRRHLVYLPWQ